MSENIVDPDETQHYVASDQSLHCLFTKVPLFGYPVCKGLKETLPWLTITK